MGTDNDIVTKPPIPPKPQFREGKWCRVTDATPKPDVEDTKQLNVQTDPCSLTAHANTEQEMCTAESKNPESETSDNYIPLNTKDSSPQLRPIPKPRSRRPPQTHTLSVPDNNKKGKDTVCAPLSDSTALNVSIERDSFPDVCMPSCPCVCHRSSRQGQTQIPPHQEDQPEVDAFISTGQNTDQNITDLEEPSREPPNIPIPTAPKKQEEDQVTNGDIDSELRSVINKPMPKPMLAKFKQLTQPSTDTGKFSRQRSLFFSSKKKKKSIRRKRCVTPDNPVRKDKRGGLQTAEQNQLLIELKLKFSSNCSSSQPLQTTTPSPAHSLHILPSAGLEEQGSENTNEENAPDHKENDDSQQCSLKKLWQERYIVKKSIILSGLTPEEICLQENMYEVLTSEQTYLERLNVAVDHFQQSSALDLAICPRDQKSLFSSISKIRETSQSFVDSIVKKMESSVYCNAICDIVHEYASGPLGAYVDYIRNMSYQQQTFHNLRKESPQFVEIISKLEEDPICNRLSFQNFLSIPFQRISHMKVLMQTIVKRADLDSNVHASAGRALTEISKVVEECNRVVGEMENMDKLLQIATKTEFECKVLPLVSSSRWLVREGDFHILQKENIFGHKKISSVHLFLFNDLLLVTIKKGPDRYIVQDHVHRSLIDIVDGVDLEEDLARCDLSRVFCLGLIKNHRGVMSHYFLQAESQAERDSWMEVLRGQKDGETTVYEEWDCPEVRCVKEYYGQQQGELSLQPEDVVSVIQKTSDGYIEGQRLSDGERGWFPAENVIEIPNEHVQRRNIRERYYVLQKAEHVVKLRNGCQQSRSVTCFS